MIKNCENCKYFKNNTCVNFRSDNAYQAVKYDVCIYWENKNNDDK